MVGRKVDFHGLQPFRDFCDMFDERVDVSHFVVVPCEDLHECAVHDARHAEVGNRAVGQTQNVGGNKLLIGDGKHPLPAVGRGGFAEEAAVPVSELYGMVLWFCG